MLANLRKPHPDLAAVILRLGLGAIFIEHGYLKVFVPDSWTVPAAWKETITPAIQNIVGWAELIFGLLIVLGLLSRLAALGVIADMIGAIVVVTGQHGFISTDMERSGFTFRASGFEYNLIIIAACLALAVLGAGLFSVDHLIFGRKKAATAAAGAPLPRSENPIAPTIKVGER